MQKDVFARSVADCICKNWKLSLSEKNKGERERRKGFKIPANFFAARPAGKSKCGPQPRAWSSLGNEYGQ